MSRENCAPRNLQAEPTKLGHMATQRRRHGRLLPDRGREVRVRGGVSDPLPGDQAVRPDLPHLPADIRRHPGAHGPDDSFRSWATCLSGYPEGSGRTVLAGFRERLAEDLGHGTALITDLVRETLAPRLVLPAVGTSRFRSPTADEDAADEEAAAATGLFEPVGQFRGSRTSSDQARAYIRRTTSPATSPPGRPRGGRPRRRHRRRPGTGPRPPGQDAAPGRGPAG